MIFWDIISTTCNLSNWIMFGWRVSHASNSTHATPLTVYQHLHYSVRCWQPRWPAGELCCVVVLLNVQYVAVDECLSAFQCRLFRAVLLHLLLQPPGCHLVTVELLDWLFLCDGQSCNWADGIPLHWQATALSSECVCLVCSCAPFRKYVYFSLNLDWE